MQYVGLQSELVKSCLEITVLLVQVILLVIIMGMYMDDKFGMWQLYCG